MPHVQIFSLIGLNPKCCTRHKDRKSLTILHFKTALFYHNQISKKSEERMRRYIKIIIIFILLSNIHASLAGEKQGNIYRVYVANYQQMNILLSQDVEIVAMIYGKSVDIQCSEKRAVTIASLGLKIELVMIEKEALATMEVPDGFHNYEETKTFLHEVANNYPKITFLDSIGASVENRGLWALKISDNPAIDEDEPCFLVEGCIHGNENHSLEVCLFFIQYMVENYGTDAEVTYWVENREIWVVPLVNPDGHERNVRRNADDVDLNRNFGYWWGFAASRHGPVPFSEPETRAIRDLAIAIKPYGSLAFHTAGRVILYPWAYISDPITPDDALFIETSSELVDSINAVDPQIQYNARRSGTWYWHGGEHNDWMYSQYGMLSLTIELMNRQSAPPSDHENEVLLPAFRVMLRRPDKGGITGLITDADTGEPLVTEVKIIELFDEDQLRSRTSEPFFGRYYRFLTPGTYTLEIYNPGYLREIRQITILEGDAIQIIDFQLKKDADIAYSNCIIDDDCLGDSQGDGNGLFNRGEVIEFGILAKNIGTYPAHNVYGILSTNSQYVTIIQDSIYFGEIDSAACNFGANSLLLRINPYALPGMKCKMHIDFYDESGHHWKSNFTERIQGFFDDMEIEGRDQWTHDFVEGAINTQDDWQYGKPLGESGDPSYAHSPDFVWGNDLGSGSWNGSYQNDVHNFLQMRTLNFSGWDQVFLQFYRWLRVSSGDQAYISVNDNIVWDNLNKEILETSWSRQIVDISSLAGSKDSVIIKFGLKTDISGTDGGWTIDDVFVHHEILLNVEEKPKLAKPSSFSLYQNYPNPFNSNTNIRIEIPELRYITIAIYNLLGQKVKTVVSSKLPAGTYHFNWQGDNDQNTPVASGVYLMKLISQDIQLSRKLLLLR